MAISKKLFLVGAAVYFVGVVLLAREGGRKFAKATKAI